MAGFSHYPQRNFSSGLPDTQGDAYDGITWTQELETNWDLTLEEFLAS